MYNTPQSDLAVGISSVFFPIIFNLISEFLFKLRIGLIKIGHIFCIGKYFFFVKKI